MPQFFGFRRFQIFNYHIIQIKNHEAARVRTAPIVAREMVRTLSTTTTVESENEIQLFPRVSGVVTELHAEEGDRVAAGEVLAVIDDREAKSALADAQAALKELLTKKW